MKKMNFMKIAGIALTVLFILSSCEKDKGGISLAMKGKLAGKKSIEAGNVVITDFSISIRDVEFKKDESELDSMEVQFRGPFEVDLLMNGDALEQSVGKVDLEDGTYKVLRFKLHKSRDWEQTSNLYDRSVYMAGTIDGLEFEFWHDTSENFDIENSQGIVVSGSSANVVVNFNIDMFLNALHQLDLSTAADTDEDGLIEINPDNEDGNSELADLLKENIKMSADLIKE